MHTERYPHTSRRVFKFDYVHIGNMEKHRGHSKGFDERKIALIWRSLNQKGDFMYINEISRETDINPVTVRYYLDHYFKNFIEERNMAPIKGRFVRLKADYSLDGILKALKYIK